MEVLCICKKYKGIKKGILYEVLFEEEYVYVIMNDKNQERRYYKYRFIELNTARKNKLKRLEC